MVAATFVRSPQATIWYTVTACSSGFMHRAEYAPCCEMGRCASGPRLPCASLGGARAHLTRPACTIIGVGPSRLYTLWLWAWALGYGPWGARITRGVLELISYFRHSVKNIRFWPELAALYFPIPVYFRHARNEFPALFTLFRANYFNSFWKTTIS